VNARKRRCIAAGLVAAVIVAVITVWGIGVARVARALLGNVREARALVAEPGDIGFEAAGQLLLDVRANVLALDRRAGWLVPPAGGLGWVPKVGPLLAQAPAAMELADSLTAVGVLMWRDLQPVVRLYEQGVGPADLVPDAARALVIDQGVKSELAARAASACEVLDPAAVPDQYSDELQMVCDLTPLMASGLRAVDALPRMLGLDRPRTYLVLALNEDELRPGGGFITGVGEVQVIGGRVADVSFSDSYRVDDFSQPYPDPPNPIRAFMGIDLWVFRDSNWSPDFPTAAERAVSLYRPGHSVALDGVIGIDQTGVQQFIGALGPLWIEGFPGAVTGDNFYDYVYETWAPEDGDFDGEWWRERKSFMADVAAAALARVEEGAVDVTALGQAVQSTLGTRHLQVYLRDPSGQTFLREQGWDGGVSDRPGDFLMLVEANLGYNKASANVTRDLAYEVSLSAPIPQARLAVDYRHQGQVADACEPEVSYDPSYVEMMDRCYWAYARFLVPGGARLLSETATPIAAARLHGSEDWPGHVVAGEVGARTAFGQGFLLPAAGTQRIELTYELPSDTVRVMDGGIFAYDLLMQKQAGVREINADIVLRLPQNAVLLHVHPDVSSNQGGVLRFISQSDTDIEISIRYHLEKGGAQ